MVHHKLIALLKLDVTIKIAPTRACLLAFYNVLLLLAFYGYYTAQPGGAKLYWPQKPHIPLVVVSRYRYSVDIETSTRTGMWFPRSLSTLENFIYKVVDKTWPLDTQLKKEYTAFLPVTLPNLDHFSQILSLLHSAGNLYFKALLMIPCFVKVVSSLNIFNSG